MHYAEIRVSDLSCVGRALVAAPQWAVFRRGQFRVKPGHEIDALATSLQVPIAAAVVAVPKLSAKCQERGFEVSRCSVCGYRLGDILAESAVRHTEPRLRCSRQHGVDCAGLLGRFT